MVFQRARINAGSQEEFDQRKQDLLDRGYEVEYIAPPVIHEHLHYNYKERHFGVQKIKTGQSQTRNKFFGTFTRDYTPPPKEPKGSGD